jgi:hypothetical protein
MNHTIYFLIFCDSFDYRKGVLDQLVWTLKVSLIGLSVYGSYDCDVIFHNFEEFNQSELYYSLSLIYVESVQEGKFCWML